MPTKVCLVKAMFFSSSHIAMWELDYKESWAWKNSCFWTVVLEKTLESLWTARGSNQSILKKSVMNIHWKNWYWSSDTLATWCEELTHWKRPWCWERLKAGGEGNDRGWDGWMTSLTELTWVWVGSSNWWCTGKLGVLQSMGLQRVGHDCAAELNWTDVWFLCLFYIWKFLVHVLLKPSLKDFENNLTTMGSECTCAVV